MKSGRSKSSGPAPSKVGAKEKTAPTWVKLLVGFHVFATVVWTLPNLGSEVMSGRVPPTGTKWLLYWNAQYLKNFRPVSVYMMTTGAWQYWDMFAPDPSNTDWYCTADVEYQDGTVRTVAYPRMADLPITEKYVKERYRKFFERAHNATEPTLWPVFAQRMAVIGYLGPQNLPKIVRLVAHSRTTAAPGMQQNPEYQTENYYAYLVDQKLLKQAMGEQ